MQSKKKANLRDIPEYIAFAMVFGFLVLMASTMLVKINTNISGIDNSTIPSEAKVGASDLASGFSKYYDVAFLLMFLVFFGFSVIMARLIPSNPVFIIIGIVYLIGLPFGSLYVMNIWDGIASNVAFADGLATLTIIPFMLSNLIYFVILYVGGVTIAFYTKED